MARKFIAVGSFDTKTNKGVVRQESHAFDEEPSAVKFGDEKVESGEWVAFSVEEREVEDVEVQSDPTVED